jgi:hypothetical protein
MMSTAEFCYRPLKKMLGFCSKVQLSGIPPGLSDWKIMYHSQKICQPEGLV